MNLYPAVDIKDGKAVRLEQGDFERVKLYDDDPIDAAVRWIDAGASHLHIVDLDGARLGRPINLVKITQIAQMAKDRGVFVQVGGGMRTSTDIAWVSHTGVDRILLGSVALSDKSVLEGAVESLGEKVAVSIDARDGVVKVKGWEESDARPLVDAINEVCESGVRRLVFTSIDEDGTMEGPNIEQIKLVAEVVKGSFIYAGGIGTVEDLEKLSSLGIKNLEGVIVGKALYENMFTVQQAQSALSGA